eukprot:2741527-Alexandrium_andersonii.AAC.1
MQSQPTAPAPPTWLLAHLAPPFGPPGQTALSAAPNRRKSEDPPASMPRAGGTALRAASPAPGPAEW